MTEFRSDGIVSGNAKTIWKRQATLKGADVHLTQNQITADDWRIAINLVGHPNSAHRETGPLVIERVRPRKRRDRPIAQPRSIRRLPG